MLTRKWTSVFRGPPMGLGSIGSCELWAPLQTVREWKFEEERIDRRWNERQPSARYFSTLSR
jgi:hypothetical protein